MSKESNIVYGPVGAAPVLESTAGKQLFDSLKRHGHLPQAIIDYQTKQSISYKNLFEATCKLAHSLEEYGLKQNDVIAICSENNLNFYKPVCAALYCGIVIAPLNDSYSEGEYVNALNISEPKLIFCSKKCLPRLVGLKARCSFIKGFVVIDSTEDINGNECLPNFILRNSDPNFDIEKYEPRVFNSNEQVAAILLSSGTTGFPKGVMLTHKNFSILFAHANDPVSGTQRIPGTTVLSILPYFHGFGFITNISYIKSGIRVVMLQRFEPEAFLRAIEEYEVRSTITVPPILIFLAKSPIVDKYNLSSLKEIICGAAPSGREIVEAVVKRLKVSGIRYGYGLTECGLAICTTPPNNFKIGSSGVVVPFMAVKIRDVESGKTLKPTQIGEICVKGDMLMKGYAGNEKATKEMIDEDGWLHTGDIGYFDKDGHIYIVDRIKELIKYKGFQVPPAELEALLLHHPCVKDAAVIGIPDELAGELPAAFIVKQHGKEVTEKEIVDYIAKQVSSAKHLRGGVRFIPDIPRTAAGKIQRNLLRNMIAKKKSKL
uniref:Luciferin 4-monooxygenase n=1 Tax=Agrypnus binodulus binodulus TaxID=341278 RepID=A9ZPM4_9COLE|nr:luciferase homologue [Agrypnus binodulus binodulus]